MSDASAPTFFQPDAGTAFCTTLRVWDKWSGSGSGLPSVDLSVDGYRLKSESQTKSVISNKKSTALCKTSKHISEIRQALLCLVFLICGDTTCVSTKNGYSLNIFLSENQNAKYVLEQMSFIKIWVAILFSISQFLSSITVIMTFHLNHSWDF